MTQILNSIKEWRSLRASLQTHLTLGFVPTMGNLHAGHQSLLHRSVKENDKTVLSIFINPTQFNNPQDLEHYPKTFEQDILMAKEAKVDFVISPSAEEIYPDQYRYRILETQYSQSMEGQHRPGHFDGMLTVVMKLLQLVKATCAYFGEKDYQQLALVRGLVDAFFIDTEIIDCPTIRDTQGLAFSSRNQRLSAEEYQTALLFPQFLSQQKSCHKIQDALIAAGITVEYIEEHLGRRFGAVKIGNVRLIDNFVI